jgi:hypothetical protein
VFRWALLGTRRRPRRRAGVGESLVLLGISARRILQALADGETDPTAPSRRSRPLACAPRRNTLCDASRRVRCAFRSNRRLLKLTLDELRMIEDQLKSRLMPT